MAATVARRASVIEGGSMSGSSPHVVPSVPKARPFDAPVHVLGLRGASVVIVDDEDTARTVLDQMVRGVDPEISTAVFPSGGEALAWLKTNDADLVISDYRMPGMNGAQLAAQLRQDARLRHVPVMVVTATNERAVRYEALEAGAVDFLAKPIDPIEVRTRCRNLLLLTRQYRLVKDYSLLQERKLDQLQDLLRPLMRAGGGRDLAERLEQGEFVTLGYEKLFAITSCIAGVQELVDAAQRHISELESQLVRPLRRADD
jgi:CheY-like chemotaxis protein